MTYLNPLPSLLQYTGLHQVGSAEYEVSLKALGIPPLQEGASISTIRFRIFYPAVAGEVAKGIPWVPQPQSTYLEGYMKLAKLGPWLSTILLSIPLFLRSTTFPAYEHASLASGGSPLPVLIFSHGLIGSLNSHSAILGELASHGMFCAALEHRDGSGALSLVRSPQADSLDGVPTELSSVYYRRISLKMRPGVLEERDEQIQIRLFELMALYQALELLNDGTPLDNLASTSKDILRIPKASLNLEPSSVIWAGHSFGGTTTVQLVKSIYYSQERREDTSKDLLLRQPTSSLKAQVTPQSPVVLLDPWFMPLKSRGTRWLLDKPLPCHHATPGAPRTSARTVVVMSTEFAYHWPECHSHMPAITSSDPTKVKIQTDEEYEEEFKLYTSPRDFMNKSKKAKAALTASREASKKMDTIKEEVEEGASSPVASFMMRDTTHVTHSDFGLLFQWVTWWFTGQKQPELAVQNIAHCILGAAGLPVSEPSDETVKAKLERLS